MTVQWITSNNVHIRQIAVNILKIPTILIGVLKNKKMELYLSTFDLMHPLMYLITQYIMI